MSYHLWLDDDAGKGMVERDPPNDGNTWVIVKSSQEAEEAIMLFGLPKHISFDHDLGGQDNAMIFLKWLEGMDSFAENIIGKFTWDIHSKNPVGAANIQSFLISWLKASFL